MSAFDPRPMFAPPVPMLGGSPIGLDAVRKFCTKSFGYAPDGAVQGAIPYRHQGQGRIAMVCDDSGEHFPSSRMRRQYDGRMVGDIYLKQAPRNWPRRCN